MYVTIIGSMPEIHAHFICKYVWLLALIHTPSLVAKISVVQKTQKRQTFNEVLNHHCDLDLEHSNPVCSQDTLAYDDVPLS